VEVEDGGCLVQQHSLVDVMMLWRLRPRDGCRKRAVEDQDLDARGNIVAFMGRRPSLGLGDESEVCVTLLIDALAALASAAALFLAAGVAAGSTGAARSAMVQHKKDRARVGANGEPAREREGHSTARCRRASAAR